MFFGFVKHVDDEGVTSLFEQIDILSEQQVSPGPHGVAVADISGYANQETKKNVGGHTNVLMYYTRRGSRCLKRSWWTCHICWPISAMRKKKVVHGVHPGDKSGCLTSYLSGYKSGL